MKAAGAGKSYFFPMRYQPRKIIVDPGAEKTPAARRVLSRCPEAAWVRERVLSVSPLERESTLYLMDNPGAYFKPCPQTPEYACCGYRILNFSTGCPIHCTYCILNGYLHSRAMTFFCDHGRMFAELDQALRARGPFRRVGSGEFTDSLVLDHLTDFSVDAIPFFLGKKNVLYEMKTKTDNIENLLKFDGMRKVLVSWSVNPPLIIDREEKGSATLAKRLDAAQRCMKNNYLVGFHFDPIIRHGGWEENYARLVDEIYRRIDPERIAWISLGCFRFVPELKKVIQEIYPGTKIIYEEFVRGKDGKMRYFRPLREAVYSLIVDRIKKYHRNPPVYFCMETPLVWERVLGREAFDSARLAGLLDKVRKKFQL